MQRDGRNLNHYKRACHIKDKKEIAAVIAPYFKKSAKQIQVSLFHMKLVINYIFRSGFGVKRAITTVIGGYVSPELDLHHHFIFAQTCEEIKHYSVSDPVSVSVSESASDAAKSSIVFSRA